MAGARFVVRAEPDHPWRLRLLGLPVIRRHVLWAQRAGARSIVVLCAPTDRPALASLLGGTRAQLLALSAPERETYATATRAAGAELLSCDQLAVGPRRLPLTPPSARRETLAQLCRAAYKDTDNRFARINRRVSLPISRMLLRTNVSPNSVSLIGVFIGFAAAWSYTRGSY